MSNEKDMISDTAVMELPLRVNKIIYAKPFKMEAKEVNEILKLEIEYHLRMYPELQFVTVGNVVDNEDRSKTFPLIFKKKA